MELLCAAVVIDNLWCSKFLKKLLKKAVAKFAGKSCVGDPHSTCFHLDCCDSIDAYACDQILKTELTAS